ncbi:MAG: hypothetical protein Q7W30_05820 [Coriobacteriia bacterium]|nr:hypothetical protein [Coriobacteriia bacterium]
MGAMVKASVVKAGHDYMRSTYGEATWREMLERLSDDEFRQVQSIGLATQVPVAVDGKVFAALVDVRFGGNSALAEGELRRGGATQADAMLDGVFSVFARFISPEQAYARAGSIITSVYTGVTSETEPLNGAKTGVLRLRGLGESLYVAPWQCGWMERAIQRFGASGCSVTERSWLAGRPAADELVYDIRW